ncbi:hypothetical protein [Hoylesella oralis]|uniref:hypothetical protein n=1 Tax=Hoylesella oralis TaxID=28134 RepID=UPI0012DF63C5|nr:hypothetical protein [Hoylesella oralis]
MARESRFLARKIDFWPEKAAFLHEKLFFSPSEPLDSMKNCFSARASRSTVRKMILHLGKLPRLQKLPRRPQLR